MNWMTSLRQRIWPPSTTATLRLDRHSLPLDGVRGLAVLLVLCYDCLKLPSSHDIGTLLVRRFAASGWVGVDLFFVLSGFLITGVLIETRGYRGYWKSFFLRRVVRIFPLYYGTLFAIFFAIPAALWMMGAGPTATAPFDQIRGDQGWYWTHTQNWLFAWREAWPYEVPVKHFWSLAVEEQFYLLWPLVVAFLTRRQLGWCCLSLSVFALSTRVCLLTQGVSPMVILIATFTRLDSLCCGAGLAIALRDPVWRERLVRWLPSLAVGTLMGIACLDLVYPILKSESFAAYSIGHTLIAIAFASLIGAAATVPPNHLIARVFSLRTMTMFGKFSYAIYVFHRFNYHGVQQLDWSGIPQPWRGWAIFLTTVTGSLLAAQVSWVLLEAPCLRLKKYFPRPDASQSELSPAELSPAELSPAELCSSELFPSGHRSSPQIASTATPPSNATAEPS